MTNKENKNRKVKRSVWLPIVLLIYIIAMTAWFAPSLIAQGEVLRLVLVVGVELVIIAILYILLKRREKQSGI
ncbi:MAG: hypothetical protein K2M87_06405 [Muribaculaceae bacterium]|nr:hypothetical protein [Muribaculaceae bacterium]